MKVTCYASPCYAVFPSLFYIIYFIPLHPETPSVCEKSDVRVVSSRFHIKLSAYHPVLSDIEIMHMYISMPVCAHTHMH